MTYLFDSSGIYSTMELGVSNKIVGNYTLDLARYELGNIIWKEHNLFKRITWEEHLKVMETAGKVVGGLKTIDIAGNEKAILALATNLGLSFYDASYVYFAKIYGVPMVTKDKKLKSKVKDYIKFADVELI